MATYDRAVRFEDIDAAHIVFFPRFLNYCHEAMEHLFSSLDGGYQKLVTQRHLGFPAVHVDVDYKAPLAYGDVARIETQVAHVGATSCTLRYTMRRAADGILVATVNHVCVMTNLRTFKKEAFPDDVRAVLVANAI